MNPKKGFTLIELLTVVAIIAILSAVAIPSYLSSKAKSRDSIRLGDLKSLSLAAENSFQENGYANFPTTLAGMNSYFTNNVVPNDPQGKTYFYAQISSPTKGFCIGTNMEVITQPSQPCTISGENYTVKGP